MYYLYFTQTALFMKITKSVFFIFIFLLIILQDANALKVEFQYPNGQNTCGESQLIIKVTNTLAQIIGPVNLEFRLNSSMSYGIISTNVQNSFIVQTGNKLKIFFDTLAPTNTTFVINAQIYSNGTCSAANCSQLTQVSDTLFLRYNGVSEQYTNQTFLKSPCISYDETEFYNRITSASIGDTVTRRVVLRNTGSGIFSGVINFEDNYLTYVEIDTIYTSSVNVLVPSLFSGKTGDSTYTFSASFENVKNSDSIVIIEKIILKKCIENNEGKSSIFINWGCGNTPCQKINPYPITAQILKDLKKPQLDIKQLLTVTSRCIDGTTHYRYIIKNKGSKKAKDIVGEITFNEKNTYSYIVPGSMVFSDTIGMTLTQNSYGFGFFPKPDFQHTCIPLSSITNFKFKFNSLLEADSFVIDFDVQSCCPQSDTANKPLAFESYFLRINYNNICGSEINSTNSLVTANTDLFWNQLYEPLITDMNGGPYLARDTASFEIRNTAFSSSFYKLDIKNAIFQIVIKSDTGLAYVDKNRIYINSAYGYPLYPFKVENVLGASIEDYQDTLLIASFAFPDTFNIDKKFFQKYFSYSSVFFDLRAYCPSSNKPTRFTQEVYVNPDTTCASSCNMLLSSISSTINVHCPGCITPGWVAYKYNVTRTSYGERDNNNDRLPDFSTYVKPDLTKIKKSRYTIGDTVLTELKAYFQDGDSPKGRTKNQLENNGAKSFTFKYNYLKTNISDGKLYSLNYVKVYINDIDRNAISSGIDSVVLPKSTVQKIVNINDSLPDAVFFYDLSLDTLYKYGLTNNYKYDASDMIRVVSSFTIANPSDFYITTPPNVKDPWKLFEENTFRIQNFDNIIFLSGEKNTFPNIGIDATEVVAIDPNLLDSTMIYMCEGYGGVANWIGRKAVIYVDMPSSVYCKSTGKINLILNPGGESFRNPFPYEYRDLIDIDSIRIFIPTGYTLVNSSLTTSIDRPIDGVEYDLCSYTSNSFINRYDAVSNSFLIYVDSTLKTATQFNGGLCPNSFVNGDERLYTDLGFYFKADCATPIPERSYPSPELYYTTYPEKRKWKYTYLPALPPLKIRKESANLELTPASNDFQLNLPRYCYPITLEERSGLATYHSFINVVSLDRKLIADTLFSLDKPGAYFLPDTTGAFRLDTIVGGSLNKYNLCLANQCSDAFIKDSLIFYYGYDCDSYPKKDFSNICQRKVVTHYFQPADLDIQSYLESPSQIKTCDDFELVYAANITGIGKISNFLVNILKEDLKGIYYKSGTIEYNGNSIKIPNQIINGHILNLDSSIKILKPTGLTPGDNLKIKLSFYTNCLYEKTAFRFFIKAITSSCDTIYDDTLNFLPLVTLEYPSADNIKLAVNASNASNLGGEVALTLEVQNSAVVSTKNNYTIELPLPNGYYYKQMISGDTPFSISDSLLIWKYDQPLLSNQSQSIKVLLAYSPKNNCDTLFSKARLVQQYKTVCDGYVCFIQSDTLDYFVPYLCIPCPPLVTISDSCKGAPINNTLRWKDGINYFCIEDSLKYKIYFSPTDDILSFRFLASSADTHYVHRDLMSYDGCYYVTALNKKNTESPPSNIVCNKTCIDQFICNDLFIPNLITNNKDGKNDSFIILGAYSKLKVEIYNRWGNIVFLSEDYKNDFTGDDLSTDIYYFSVSAGNGKVCNGWVHLIK